MALFDSFDSDTPELISPFNVTEKTEGFPETVIVVYSDRVSNILPEKFSCEKISSMRAGTEIPIYKITYKNIPLAFYRTPLGAPAASVMLEEATAKGGKNFLFFGSCGVLDSDIKAGEILVPVSAFRDEGTSYHYIKASEFIDIPTAEKLSDILSSLGISHRKIKTWTTDGFYRETRGNVIRRKAEGISAVEMECAALTAVGQFRNINVYQFFFAADCLDAPEWDRRILGSTDNGFFPHLIDIALETAIRL